MKQEHKYRIWTGSIMMQPKSLLIMHQETVSGLTVGQWESQIYLEYTGLKDKNGKEIFEGDILTAQYAGSSQGPYKNKVIWDEGESGFSFANAPMWTWGNIEVIGNIYENPDLL